MRRAVRDVRLRVRTLEPLELSSKNRFSLRGILAVSSCGRARCPHGSWERSWDFIMVAVVEGLTSLWSRLEQLPQSPWTEWRRRSRCVNEATTSYPALFLDRGEGEARAMSARERLKERRIKDSVTLLPCFYFVEVGFCSLHLFWQAGWPGRFHLSAQWNVAVFACLSLQHHSYPYLWVQLCWYVSFISCFYFWTQAFVGYCRLNGLTGCHKAICSVPNDMLSSELLWTLPGSLMNLEVLKAKWVTYISIHPALQLGRQFGSKS